MPDELELKLTSTFTFDIESNISLIREILGHSVDLVQRDFIFHQEKQIRGVLFYTDGLIDKEEINKALKTLINCSDEILSSCIGDRMGDELTKNIKTYLLNNVSVNQSNKVQDAIDGILSGDTAIIIDRTEQVIILSSRGADARSIEEPQTEQVVRGPRDGFTENIRTNTALVRRRIRDPQFRVESMKIGKKSKTDVNIAYLKGTVKEGLVEEVKKRLARIEIDAVIDSGYIEELIEDAPFSPFTTVQSTERPDKVASYIFEGRVAIFVDNSPFVLTAPAYFWQFLQASDDYYSRYMSGTFFRLMRYIAFIISLTLPSLYVLLISFHQEMIPTPLALTIASGREVIPFPVLLEALIMEISFELMREAGLRMPKPVGQAVSIVGSLVIGQAAVQAGVVSPFMVIIVALTGIASFAIPNYGASFSIRLIRFPLLIASGTLGLLGFASMFTIIAIHALSLRSFGESYLAPATPFKPSDQKDFLIRMPWWRMDTNAQLAEGEQYRLGEHQVPSPPPKGVDKEGDKGQKPPEKKKSDNENNPPSSKQSLVKIRRKKRKWGKKDET
ncbi:spore germination protein [Robertmurraya yapensis]|uniref:Spore germination protein n=1 Tax=Bacillus yapensis TaxID=2492960 RepID=A0A3S0IJU4_9BACI|nr:spore germination protein [Bacillus yapensis]RTR35803.1 spore germination protein [Bacillus yapensis]TKS98605.1 spore germination protein [Bacillus yapensis]